MNKELTPEKSICNSEQKQVALRLFFTQTAHIRHFWCFLCNPYLLI